MVKELSVILSLTENDRVNQTNLDFIEIVPCFVNITKPKLNVNNIHMVPYEWHIHPTDQSCQALSDKDKKENKHYNKVKRTAVNICDLFAGEYPLLPLLRTDILEYCQK